MDTPERSQNAGAPLSNFEDSPLFSFINSLSPIQPVKSLHSVQAYTSPGFTSISSVFSSPHVNLQKESRFLTRHPYLDPAKQENSLENGDESNLCTGVSNAVKLSSCIVVAQENCNIKCSFNVDRPDECSTLPCNLPHSVQYDCGSPNHSVRPCYGAKLDPKLDIDCTHVEVIQFVQDGLDKRKSLFAAEVVQEHHLTEQIKEEVPGCDWENLISDDADDLLVFDDSTESEACEDQNEKLQDKDANSLTSFSSNLAEKFVDDSQKTQTDDFFGPCLQNTTQDPHVTHSGEIGEQNETDHTPQIVARVSQRQVVMSNQSQNMGNGTSDCFSFGYKADSHKQRGIRRRCLVFEISGVSKRNSLKDSNLHPSDCLPSKRKITSDNRLLTSLKPGASPSPCVLPGIGLHLNTLAATSKDRVATQETLASRRQLIGMPCSVDPFPLRTAKQKSLNRSLAVEKDLQPTGSEIQNLQIMHDDLSQTPELGSGDELSQSSPRKKRSKTEGRESESCKHCKCKKSKCLKLYCECFAAGVYCIEQCSCQGCYNKPIHEETVLATRKQIEARNPLAFAPKVIPTSDNVQDMRTPASARHKRGCNCKKSSCLKKYCECYQGGAGCSISCRCEGCKNAFGRKDGVVPMGAEEIEPGEEEMDACEKESDEGQDNADIQKDESHFPENVLLTTPSQFCRTSIKSPFFSSGKPPRSFTLPIGNSLLLDTCQTLRKSEISPSNLESISRFGEHIKIIPEDDTPEILRGNASPSNCVKTTSPNGKRVSPPHNGIGMSPSRKGVRKLILKSIPSFPSLSSDVTNEHPVNHSNSSFNSSLLS